MPATLLSPLDVVHSARNSPLAVLQGFLAIAVAVTITFLLAAPQSR